MENLIQFFDRIYNKIQDPGAGIDKIPAADYDKGVFETR